MTGSGTIETSDHDITYSDGDIISHTWDGNLQIEHSDGSVDVYNALTGELIDPATGPQ